MCIGIIEFKRFTRRLFMESNSNNRSLVSGFFVLGIGTVINILISVITTPIITRIVEPQEYGMWSMFVTYTNIALMVVTFGLDQALIRFFFEDESLNYKRSLLRFCFLISIFGTVFAESVFVILLKTGLITFEFSTSISIILCLNVLANLLYRYSMVVLRISYQNKRYSLFTVVTKVIFAGCALVLCTIVKNYYFEILCLSTLLSFFIPAVMSIISTKEYWRFTNLDEIKDKGRILKYGFPFIISMGLSSVFNAIDKFSLNHYCSYTEVGIYTSALNIVAIFAIVQSVFNTIWAPVQVEHFTQNPEDKEFYEKVNAYITIIMFGFGFVLVLLKDVIVYLLGSRYREASILIPFLVFHPIMYTISETTNTGIEFSKKSYLHIIVGVGACVINLIGNTALVPLIGSRGAAISTGMSYIVFWALRTILSYRYFKVNYHIVQFLCVTGAMIVFAFYSSFMPFSIYTVVMFLASLAILSMLYNHELKELARNGSKYISGFIQRKKV